VVLKRKLGEGSQAEVYEIDQPGGHQGSWVLKLYRTSLQSPAGRHLVGVVQYLCQRFENNGHPALSLPQHVVVAEQDGRVGCLMPKAVGEPLSDPIYEQLYQDRRGLAARLQVALWLAEGLAALHRHHFVHADVMEPNVFVDLLTLRLTLVDVDGGGVLTAPLSGAYQPGMAPLVRGRFEGSCLAPELVTNVARLPDLASDRWSLAVLLHRILFAGLDPFFFVRAYKEVVNLGATWPPDGRYQRSSNAWFHFQEAELRRLGEELAQLFRATFNIAGARNPKASVDRLRPYAEEWARALDIARRWVLRCRKCGEEIVATGRSTCPFCQTWLPHAEALIPGKKVILNREGISLLGRDLGFTDLEGRYEALSFRRHGGRLLLSSQGNLRITRRALWSGPVHTPLMLDPGLHMLRVRSRSGLQEAEVAIHVP